MKTGRLAIFIKTNASEVSVSLDELDRGRMIYYGICIITSELKFKNGYVGGGNKTIVMKTR